MAEVLTGWLIRATIDGHPIQAVHLNAASAAAHLEVLADPNATVHGVRIQVIPDAPDPRPLPVFQ